MPAPPVQPARQTLTRNDLIALGQAGRPWDYCSVAVRALVQVPHDAGLRFLLAANLARLGLRTLAGETLGALPESARGEGDVVALAGAIDRLADDRVCARERRRTALGNLRALRARGFDADGSLSAAFGAWSAGLEGDECFRAVEGNLGRRLGRAGSMGWEHFLIDQRSAAGRYCEQLGASRELLAPALAIEGLDPPWLFEGAWRVLGRNRVGYSPPLTILQADAMELLDGLSALDLREPLMDPRVAVFAGRDASQRWINDALTRVGEMVLGTAVAVPGVRARVSPPPEAATGRVSAGQAEEFRRLQSLVGSRYAGRDAAWWAARYRDARSGGPPLRVLVPTSRYSTYIRHAAEDLAAAFRALGCEARLSIEANLSSRPSAVGHLQPVAEFEPDLVALINYFRGDAGLPYPEQLPWVCWLQDAMPHQFAERRWGALDFVAGHVPVELRQRAEFPRERSMPFPVVASGRKFHAGPVGRDLASRFACEVAYVSHQSETPAAFHARIRAESADGQTAAVLDELRPLLEAEALEPMAQTLTGRLRRITREVVDRCTGHEAAAAYTFRHYAVPLADRVLRHQALGWAAEICARRGWRLKVFGRGWEAHPRLAPYACGEVAHGEELRACYQSAAVHLHASVTTLVHQRVMECAMSGGLPLGRLTMDTVEESTGWAKREAVQHHTPRRRDGATGEVWYRTADCQALASIGAMRRALGEDFPEELRVTPEQVASFRRPDHPGASGLHSAWLFGGFSGLMFRSEAELEKLVARAVEDSPWRAAESAAMADRVRERCTVEVFAARVLELITGSLAGEAGRAGDGATSAAA